MNDRTPSVPYDAGHGSAGGDEARAADHLVQAALAWQVNLWSGEVTGDERHAFERWRHADPAHESAWQQVQRLVLKLHGAPTGVASRVLRTPKAPAARRNLLRGLGAILGAAFLAHAARETPQWQAAAADYRTARGERRNLTLPDGTKVALNTASAIDLRYVAQERRLILRTGEIMVTTAHEQSQVHRPFIVETHAGAVRALGTHFMVRQLDGGPRQAVSVQVFEGAVEITPRRGTDPVPLVGGQQSRFTEDDAEEPRASDPLSGAWAKGLHVAERQRLEDFLAELARHRPGVLRCDPAVADLMVSGVYPLADTDVVLQSLSQALPIKVRMTTRYVVTVTAR